MVTAAQMLSYVKAKPFRPFRFTVTTGKAFAVQHPDVVKVLRSYVLVFFYPPGEQEVFDRWESVPLTYIETISVCNGEQP
jgi:hypothetical protein